MTRPADLLSAWVSKSVPHTTTYRQRQPVLPVDKVAAIAPGRALAMWPGLPPVQIGLVPAWSEPWTSLLKQATSATW